MKPGPRARHPNAAVACGHEVTAAAAREVLEDGGNAFDAAIAAACAACVAEPVLCSLGGGGYLLASPAGGEALAYDFFVDTPRHKRPAAELDLYPIDADFGPTTQQFHIGAMRNCKTRMFRAVGPDTGCDSIGDLAVARPLQRLLDRLDQTGRLCRTILYNLNPRENAVLATMLGNFQDGSVPG